MYYKDKQMKEKWWSPSAIKYTKAQVRWLIPHLSLLGQGVYPRSHKETGYEDNPIGKRQRSNQAPFIKAIEIHGELTKRIVRAGVDGLLLEFLYAFELEDEVFIIEHIAQCLNLERKEVEQRIRNALYFVSGADRKAGSYSQYVKEHYYQYLKIK